MNLFKLLPQVRCVLALQVYLPLKLVGALDLKIELLPHLAELVVNDSQDVRGVRKLDRVAHAHRQGPLHLQGHAHRSHRVAPSRRERLFHLASLWPSRASVYLPTRRAYSTV